MSSIIKIKRSSTSSTPANLFFGELAYSSVNDTLYIGNPNSIPVAIGSKRTPGILTANQSIVVDANSSINEIKPAVLVADKISANGSFGDSGQVIVSGGSAESVSWKTLGITYYDSLVQYYSTYIPYTPNTDDFVLIQPVINSFTLQQNFTNCVAYTEINSTGNAVFSVYKNANLVGNITFINTQTNAVFSNISSYHFDIGDILKIKYNSAQDATLKNFNISLMVIKDTA